MSIFIRTPKPNEHARILADLRRELEELSLPENLKVRLLRDSDGGPHYRRLLSIADLDAMPPNSSYIGFKCGGCCCRLTILVEAGNVALMNDNGVNFFLAPGYHSVPTFGVEINEAQVSLATVNRAVTCGTVGFITITEGNIGVMMLGSEYKLLAPGTYEWNSPVVGSVTAVDIRKSASQLGPFSLVTVSEGNAAVTYHHGSLKILGWSAHEAAEHATPFASTVASRTFFMDDPNWVHKSFLSTHIQTDRLEGNDLLSKDNVELIMVAMSQWRIVNPHLAITHCGHDMTAISTKVDQLVRATIARIVAATCIGAGPVGGHMARPVGKAASDAAAKGVAAGGGDADMAHLMQSPEATQFMAELTHNMQHMGIEVVGVYVPEKRIKNDDTRSEIAKQAVIGIKAEAQRAAADASSYATIKAAQAESEADRARADARAYVTVTVARADAVAIAEVAQAHSRAGELLGPPTNTAARLALSEKTGKALENANVTIFSGAPSMMPFMFSGEPGRS